MQVTRAAVQAPVNSLERAISDSFEAGRMQRAAEEGLQMSKVGSSSMLGVHVIFRCRMLAHDQTAVQSTPTPRSNLRTASRPNRAAAVA